MGGASAPPCYGYSFELFVPESSQKSWQPYTHLNIKKHPTGISSYTTRSPPLAVRRRRHRRHRHNRTWRSSLAQCAIVNIRLVSLIPSSTETRFTVGGFRKCTRPWHEAASIRTHQGRLAIDESDCECPAVERLFRNTPGSLFVCFEMYSDHGPTRGGSAGP